ncbi:MAG: hypothetical protein LBR26_15455, partial [Prevotella sp.]|nr:hypothetical protein [Prevotella sp.]
GIVVILTGLISQYALYKYIGYPSAVKMRQFILCQVRSSEFFIPNSSFLIPNGACHRLSCIVGYCFIHGVCDMFFCALIVIVWTPYDKVFLCPTKVFNPTE